MFKLRSGIGKGIRRVIGSGKFRKLYRNFVYVKLCYGRFGTYMAIPKDMLDDFVRYGTFLAVLGIIDIWILVPIGLVYVLFKIIFGHIDYRFKLPQLETSVSNSFNPEITAIHKEVKKLGNIKKRRSESKTSVKQDQR